MVNGYAGLSEREFRKWREWAQYVPCIRPNNWQLTIEKQPWKGALIQPNAQRSEALGKKGDPLGGGLKAWHNSMVNG